MGELIPSHRKLTQELDDFKDLLGTIIAIMNGKIEDHNFEFLIDSTEDLNYYLKKIKANPKKYYSSWFND